MTCNYQLNIKKEFVFLMFVIDIFCKHDWAVPLKDKKGITNIDIFEKILNQDRRKT